jgi:hypothetical protein
MKLLSDFRYSKCCEKLFRDFLIIAVFEMFSFFIKIAPHAKPPDSEKEQGPDDEFNTHSDVSFTEVP